MTLADLDLPEPLQLPPLPTKTEGQEFPTRAGMQRHAVEIHHVQEKTHKCEKCFKAFPSSQQLTQHMLVHNNIRKYKCNYCDKAFKQLSHLQQHHRRHTGERPYKCMVDQCGKAFAQLSNLQQHLRNHDSRKNNAERKPYLCQVCDRRFATEASLNNHISKVHSMVSPFAEAFASLTGAHSLAPSVVMTTTPSDVVAVSNPLAFPGSNLNNALYLGGRSSVNSRTHQLPGLGFLGPLSPLAGRNSLCNAASLPNLASLAGLNSAPGDLMFPNMALVESLANNAFLMGAQFPMTSSNDANSESKPGSSASPTAMGPKLPSAAKTPPAEDLRIDQRGLVPEEGEPAPRQATESFTLSHGESRREWGSHLARQSNGQDPGAKNQHGPFQATRERDEDELVSGTLDLSVMSRGSRESSSKRQDSVFSGTAEQRYVIEGSTGSGAQTVGEDQEEDRQLREESASPEMFAKPGQCLLNEISRRDLNLLKVSRANLYDFPTQVPPVLPATYAREPVSP